jgi:hypothetical protein
MKLLTAMGFHAQQRTGTPFMGVKVRQGLEISIVNHFCVCEKISIGAMKITAIMSCCMSLSSILSIIKFALTQRASLICPLESAISIQK